MKTIYRLLLIFLLFFSFQINAEVPVPELNSRVTDLTGTLSEEQINSLNQKMKELETLKGSQLAVLVLPTTNGESIEQYSLRVVEKWKLGRKKVNDGVLILVAKNDRKMRIEVGYGLEGVLPDAICKRIISEQMRPNFKAQKFYEGIDSAIESIARLIKGENLPPPSMESSNKKASINDNILLMGILSFFVIFFGSSLTSGFAYTTVGQWIGCAIFSMVGAFINARLFFIANFSFLIIIFVWIISFIVLTILTFLVIQIMENINGRSGGSSSSSNWESSSENSWSSSSSSDSFSGGGGDFGGGGASGDW